MRRLILVPLMVILAQAQEQSISLQARIDAAAPGDTITVDGGMYEGNVLLKKTIALIGKGSPVIRGSGKGSVVEITADFCTVRGFVVEQSGGDVMREDAGILIRSDHNLIAENAIRDILFGIYLLEADSNSVAGNSIVGRRELDFGQRGSGIHIWNSHFNAFSGNAVTDARDGIYIQYANHTLIENSNVYGVRYGLHYMYADSNVFLHNMFYDNLAGAAVMYSNDIVIRHNAFFRNRSATSYGILFQDCKGIMVDSNVVADNVVGMFFEATTGSTFRSNIIAQNDIALQMFQNSTGNTFTGNNFIDNLSPISIVGKRTDSDWSSEGQGNYWSQYTGYDLDHDGIGDTPQKVQNVFGYLEGRSPNLRLYLYSPSSQALSLATSAFPIIEINREVDPFPLMAPAELWNIPAAHAVGKAGGSERRKSNAGWIGIPLIGLTSLAVLYVRMARRHAQ